MSPSLSKNIEEDRTRSVNHGRLLMEVWGRSDVASDTHHAFNAIKIPQSLFKNSKRIQYTHCSSFTTLLNGDVVPEVANTGQLPVNSRELTRGASSSLKYNHCN
jgi:hypothetical protein